MAGGGFGSEFGPDSYRAQEALRRAFEAQNGHVINIVQRLEQQEKKLKWLLDEQSGKHMSQRDHFESATKYNGIVLGVGYAGFFGLWAIVKDQGHQYPKLHAWAALLIGFSLALFVLWEVYTMFVNTVYSMQSRTIGPEERPLLRWLYFCYDGMEKAWIPVFLLTLATGLGGLGCLSWILVDNLQSVLTT